MIIKKMTFSNAYDYSEPFGIEIKLQIEDFAIPIDGKYIFTPISATPLFKNFNSHLRISTVSEKKNYGFRDACSKLIEIEEKIEFPFNFTVEYLPKLSKIQGDVASFDASIGIEDKSILFKEMISLNKRVYDKNDWQIFRKVLLSQMSLFSAKIILSKVTY